MNEVNFSELQRTIPQYFNINDLRGLCFDLDILYEDLAEETLTGKARSLIGYCRQHGRIDDLLDKLEKARPHIKWPIVQVLDSSNRKGEIVESTIKTIFDSDSPRLQALWRLAYTFLCLDQLPSGGWGKTLNGWMEMIWEWYAPRLHP